MFGPDRTLIQTDRLAEGQLDRLLGLRHEREAADTQASAAVPSTTALQRTRTERGLGALADLVEIDADRAERSGVLVTQIVGGGTDEATQSGTGTGFTGPGISAATGAGGEGTCDIVDGVCSPMAER